MKNHSVINRRNFLRTLGISAAGLSCTTSAVMAMAKKATVGTTKIHPKKKMPNILFLFTDDQRFSAVDSLFNPEVKTPVMDTLVKEGTAFTEAHIMGGTSPAVCMPSRAMLMTGRNLFHLTRGGHTISPNHVTMPQYLKQHGYITFGTGKWHNGKASYARSFTTGGAIFFGGMHPLSLGGHLHPRVWDFDPSGKYPNSKRYDAHEFSANLYSDQAVKFLRHYKSDKPFFMYVSYTSPHDPRMAPKTYKDMYDASKLTVPPNFLPEHPFDNGELRIRDELLAPFPRTPKIVRENLAAYYAMTTHVDAQMGRVLQALEDNNLADNTIVIFASDNGLALGQHGLMGKQNLYEASVRVPMVITGPGIPKGQRTNSLCYIHDIFPTLCDMLGLPIPPSVESKTLTPLIKNPKAKVRDSVFYAYRNFQRGVQKGDWKLIKYNVKGKQTTQLFNLKNDPWEITNLAHKPQHKEKLQQLTLLLAQWMRRLDDPCDINKPNWGLPIRHRRKAKA